MIEDLYKQCYKAFRAEEHEWLQNKFIYVTINSTIQRLNELRDGANDPVEWDLINKHSNTVFNPNKGNRGGEYEATCTVELTIPGLGTRMGSGGASNFDIDNAIKSAQAFACRKAANQFGVAHYLLMQPELESELVKHLNASDFDDPEAMKEAVIKLLKIRKLEVSSANLMREFNVTLEEVKDDEEVFKRILMAENRI